jgi:hypothetical protein
MPGQPPGMVCRQILTAKQEQAGFARRKRTVLGKRCFILLKGMEMDSSPSLRCAQNDKSAVIPSRRKRGYSAPQEAWSF